MSDSSAAEKKAPNLGDGDRLIDRVMRGWEEGNARIQAWFKEHALIHDPEEFLGVVLQYVTHHLDNTGFWNRFSEVQCAADIEGRYLPHLRTTADVMYQVAEAHTKRVDGVIDSETLKAFSFATRIRLDSRLDYWKAEALRYVREKEIAGAFRDIPTQTPPITPAPAERSETPAGNIQAERLALVDAFLLRVTQHTDVKAQRKHIWRAAGHSRPRQFQYWQAGSEKATVEDERNFARILTMSAAEFRALLKRKNIA